MATTSGFRKISQSQASALIQAFHNCILTSSRDGGESNIQDLFKNDSRSLYGFTLSGNEFIEVVSQIGIAHYMLHFGYDEDADFKFRLIIRALGANKSLRGDYILLETPIMEACAWGDYENGINCVPRPLFEQWTGAWQNLLNAPRIPASFCQLYTYTGDYKDLQVLQGYKFQQIDFIETLRGAEGNTENLEIGFYLVNHSQIAGDNQPQEDIGGFLGLMVAAYNSEKNNLTSSFFDFSAPCPPTCPE
ncbi:MAG TPA: hypothetical protein DCG19_15480 [Cryomorphaceae bacterium]|nr:hypothetical protein [Owenweeksia sp.]MBF97675.1 hypothetical protein [Owenweeksia sp.]HAD98814.1 hypothetical protein [Cryomorphaceae bacterium]HBF19323.1 hypothetical protein [Cryomorphaceae bacterium]HCQ17369.1 hypothetical protein [Cryomorphaceae bacterium]|tara:strand:+ start:258 stop:1001 length:744 start_codon:yes stop_codon:yes gene_type:complete